MVNTTIRRYLTQIGQRGGEAGTGESKRRDVEFYQRISRKGLKARRAKARAAKIAKGDADGDFALNSS